MTLPSSTIDGVSENFFPSLFKNPLNLRSANPFVNRGIDVTVRGLGRLNYSVTKPLPKSARLPLPTTPITKSREEAKKRADASFVPLPKCPGRCQAGLGRLPSACRR
jgi:hypothetical protein